MLQSSAALCGGGVGWVIIIKQRSGLERLLASSQTSKHLTVTVDWPCAPLFGDKKPRRNVDWSMSQIWCLNYTLHYLQKQCNVVMSVLCHDRFQHYRSAYYSILYFFYTHHKDITPLQCYMQWYIQLNLLKISQVKPKLINLTYKWSATL